MDALCDVGLLDGETRIPSGPWERHFGAAFERRRLGRERWARYNDHRPKNPPAPPVNSQSDRQSVTTRLPRGSDAVEATKRNGMEEGVDTRTLTSEEYNAMVAAKMAARLGTTP